MENKNIKDLEKQNNIVRDGLNYHFRGTTKNGMYQIICNL